MLRQFFTGDSISLGLAGTTKADVLGELVRLLGLEDRAASAILKLLIRREALGSTAVGRGIAIPHTRSLTTDRLRLAYGYHPRGLPFDAIDTKPVHHLFLIAAPPMEVSQQYLTVLARIAQFVKTPGVPERLAALQAPAEFMRLLEEQAAPEQG